MAYAVDPGVPAEEKEESEYVQVLKNPSFYFFFVCMVVHMSTFTFYFLYILDCITMQVRPCPRNY